MANENDIVVMTEESVKHYGAEYEDIELIVTHVARNEAEHPGYDMGVYPQRLYDLKRKDNGEDLQFSLYDWEIEER